MATSSQVEHLVMRIQGDFLGTSRLRLTLPEAERQFEIDRVSCEEILGVLVDARVLTQTSEGAYMRYFPRMAHAA